MCAQASPTPQARASRPRAAPTASNPITIGSGKSSATALSLRSIAPRSSPATWPAPPTPGSAPDWRRWPSPPPGPPYGALATTPPISTGCCAAEQPAGGASWTGRSDRYDIALESRHRFLFPTSPDSFRADGPRPKPSVARTPLLRPPMTRSYLARPLSLLILTAALLVGCGDDGTAGTTPE